MNLIFYCDFFPLNLILQIDLFPPSPLAAFISRLNCRSKFQNFYKILFTLNFLQQKV